MSIQGFVMVEAVGAALIALWLIVRFPSRGPESFKGALVHLGAAMLIGWALAPVTTLVVGTGIAAAGYLAAFLLILPGLIYTFVAWAWMVKLLQGAMGRSHR
jgi:hypothetical protein